VHHSRRGVSPEQELPPSLTPEWRISRGAAQPNHGGGRADRDGEGSGCRQASLGAPPVADEPGVLALNEAMAKVGWSLQGMAALASMNPVVWGSSAVATMVGRAGSASMGGGRHRGMLLHRLGSCQQRGVAGIAGAVDAAALSAVRGRRVTTSLVSVEGQEAAWAQVHLVKLGGAARVRHEGGGRQRRMRFSPAARWQSELLQRWIAGGRARCIKTQRRAKASRLV
jgi:hypothetical protein